jgi:hypothetical protein
VKLAQFDVENEKSQGRPKGVSAEDDEGGKWEDLVKDDYDIVGYDCE